MIFALTSTYRIIPIEQQLRVQETPQDVMSTSVPTSSISTKPPSASALSLTSCTKAPAFATLLDELYRAPRAPSTLKLPNLPASRVGIDEITTGDQLAQVARVGNADDPTKRPPSLSYTPFKLDWNSWRKSTLVNERSARRCSMPCKS
jgi:hypothetical protein